MTFSNRTAPDLDLERYEALLRDHSHCPFDHDHPQPFRASIGPESAAAFPHLTVGVEYEFCGACLHKDGALVEMAPCTPETCPGEGTGT